jgi:signal transduction histidine kinase
MRSDNSDRSENTFCRRIGISALGAALRSVLCRFSCARFGSNRDLREQQATSPASREELQLKSRIENVFLTTPDDQIFFETLKLLLEVMKSRFGFFGYIDRRGDMVSPTLTRDVWKACEMEQKSIVFKKEDWTGLWGRSLREGHSLIQNGGLKVPMGHVELQNALVVPIIHNQVLIGQLALANRSGGYRTAEQKTVERIAGYIAPILHIRLQRDEEIRQRELTEKALRQAKDEAEVANQAKSRFIAGMSHEFRTPLNIVIGFAEVLKGQHHGALNGKQLEYLEYIIESGTHLSLMVDDILDICNIEAGRIKLEPTAVSIRRLLQRSAELHREEVARHDLAVDIDLPPTLADSSIIADEVKLKQIMFNLISNAIKFTPDGGRITLSATRNAEELIIRISDTGIGIEAKDRETVFEGFSQLKNSDTDKTPGTGLGLNLAKRLVEIHNGRIWVESEGRDLGSCFVFTIPWNLGPA